MQTESPYLSRSEVAALLRVSVHTVKSWKRRNTGPRFRRINGRVLYERSEIRAFIEAAPAYGRDHQRIVENENRQRICQWRGRRGDLEPCGRVFIPVRGDQDYCSICSGPARLEKQKIRQRNLREKVKHGNT